MTDLLECRKEIDVIDKEILRLFEKTLNFPRFYSFFELHSLQMPSVVLSAIKYILLYIITKTIENSPGYSCNNSLDYAQKLYYNKSRYMRNTNQMIFQEDEPS